MFSQLPLLVLLNSFNAGVLENFTDENLKNWLTFEVKVEEVQILVVHLDRFVIALLVGNKDGVWCSVNVVIGLNFVFINHVLVVTQIAP